MVFKVFRRAGAGGGSFWLTTGTGTNLTFNQSPQFMTFAGLELLTTVEGARTIATPNGGVMDNLFVVVFVNSIDAVTPLISRVNLADGNLLVPVPALTTGIFSDLVNEDVLVQADEIDIEIDTAGTIGNIQIRGVTVRITP